MNNINKYKARLKPYKKLIVFILIGIEGFAIDIGVYFILSQLLDIHYLIANFISTSSSLTHNFLLNALINFKKHDQLLRRYLTYYLIGLSGVVLTSLILFVFVDLLLMNDFFVKTLGTIIVVLVQYQLHKKITFKRHATPNNEKQR